MRVIVYVEGRSDVAAMHALLQPLIDLKREQGVAIDFFEGDDGDKKKSLLLKVPKRAVNILADDPAAVVAVVPDLYPRNKGLPHETFDEMRDGICERFRAALRARIGEDDERPIQRFRVFCFKYDLEALLLASPKALRRHLRAESLTPTWHVPVEDQDHDHPPTQVIEELFMKHTGSRYRKAVDAPLILRGVPYSEVAEQCNQCFKPFVEFLADLPDIAELAGASPEQPSVGR